MAQRREVFQSKVLQKLYPAVPKREKEPGLPPIAETLANKPAVKRKALQGTVINDDEGIAPHATHPGRRVYTVSPPPAGYKAGAAEGSVTLPRPESINTVGDPADENTNESSEEEQPDGDGEVEEEQRRRRRRRRKRKQPAQEQSIADEKGQAGASGRSDVPSADQGGERLSKNKRRKLKKKRHKKKLLSLGLVPRAAALEFTYQRKEEEQEEEEEEEEEKKERRAAEVSDFLRTTMETYMSDSSLPADRPALPSSAVEELLSSVASGRAPPSVLSQLHSLMALVQHKETDTLAKALEELHNTSSMSPEESTAVVPLFRYWITDILPMQRETSRQDDVQQNHETVKQTEASK